MNNTKIDHDNCDAEYFEHNEQEIKDLLLYHKVVSVTGIRLRWTTNVEFVTDDDNTDKNNYDKSYKIFVLAERISVSSLRKSTVLMAMMATAGMAQVTLCM